MIAISQPHLTFRPRLVLACATSHHASQTSRHLRRLGWEVHLASSGPDARRLVAALAPQVVILDVDLAEESGWLTCAKVVLEPLAPQVVLVTEAPAAGDYRFARMVGATALLARESGVNGLVAEMRETALAHAG